MSAQFISGGSFRHVDFFEVLPEAQWGPCPYVIVHGYGKLPPSLQLVILWILLGGKSKWPPLNFRFNDVMRTAPINEFHMLWLPWATHRKVWHKMAVWCWVAVQTAILCHTFLCVAQGNQSMQNSSIGHTSYISTKRILKSSCFCKKFDSCLQRH